MFTKQFHRMLIASIISGFIGSMAGLVLSYYYDIPSGAAIIFTLVILYGLLKVFFLIRTRLEIKKRK